MAAEQRYFMVLSYHGKNYHGWQEQKNAVSVQEVVNVKLSFKLGEPIKVVGCGRTDTGVHAHYFVTHFDSHHYDLDTDTVVNDFNKYLPNDIVVLQIVKTIPSANARFSAIWRTYHYYITTHRTPFFNELSYFVSKMPDFDKMNEAAVHLLKVDDFSSFAKMHSDNRTNLCNVTAAEWKIEGNVAVFSITSNRFLRNMVRSIVGTLLAVGNGQISQQEFIQKIADKDRYFSSLTAFAQGLFLYEIGYPDTIFPDGKNILQKPQKLLLT